MSRTALDRAERLFASGRHSEVVALLEPQVPVYRESSRFYYVLGSSCLRSGDPSGAAAYLKRAEQLDPSDPDITLALAALHVRKADGAKAIEAYLRILDERPGDKTAKRALALLKTEGSPEKLAALARSGRIERIYPGPGASRRLVSRIALGLALACALGGLVYAALRFGGNLMQARKARPEVEAIVLNDYEKASPVSAGGSFRYLLTEAQALAAFERAKAFFHEYRDNAALVEINRLLGSNASAAVKQKAKSLKAFVVEPDFRTIRDVPGFAEVVKDPQLYDGCSVAWKGMAANVRPLDAANPAEGGSAFDFLVGYQDKARLEGIMAATMSRGPVPIDRPLELLAVLRSQEGKPRLECAAIHELQGASGK